MRYGLVGLWMLLCAVASAATQVSVGVWLPGISIGINLPAHPQFVVVPGYPVYYAPHLGWNYFFYDGMYWVFEDDTWYASYWYNGPWTYVGPEYVPLYMLRIPVRYYVRPPTYFRWWRRDAPPRWDEHWGEEWQQRRPGWDRWSRHSVPAPAPLPLYQQQYAGERYPRFEEQQELHQRVYRYRPRDAEVRQLYQQSQPQGQEPRSEGQGSRWRTVTVPPPQMQPMPGYGAKPGGEGAVRQPAKPPRGKGKGKDKDDEKDEERGQGRERD